MVPPNLRAFVTPSIRRLYIDSEPNPPDEVQGNDTPIASTSSDISRLQAENRALRNHCIMWRQRAEIQGLANLNLMKLVDTIRDQASHLAHERDELLSLDNDELSIISFSSRPRLIGPLSDRRPGETPHRSQVLNGL